LSDLVQDIARLQLRAIAGLRDLATPDGLRRRLSEMGYQIGIEDGAVAAFALGQSILDTIDSLAQALVYTKPRVEEVPDLVAEVAALIREIRDFTPDTAALDPPFDDPAFWQDFGLNLADQMVRDMLARRAPILKLILFALGIIKVEDLGDDETTRSGLIEVFDFTAIGEVLADPGAALSARFGPGSDIWTGQSAGFLSRHLHDLGLAVRARRLSSSEAEAITTFSATPGQLFHEILFAEGALLGKTGRHEAGVRVLPVPAQGKVGLGLFATGALQGGRLALGPDWSIQLEVDRDDIVQIAIGTDGTSFEPQGLSVAATLTNEAPEPLLLIGTEGATRLDLDALSLGLLLTPVGAEPEAVLSLALNGLALTVAAPDSFLGAIIGDGFTTRLDLTLAWSSRSGMTLGGSAGLAYTLPVEIVLGPITLRNIDLALGMAGDAAAFSATAGLLGNFGPFAVSIDGMGLLLALEPAADGKGLIGPFDVTAGFKPPTRFGLSIDVPSVSGGGVLEIADGRYSGALALDVIAVGIAAIVVVDTELPGDPDGWAFFAALSLTFPAIPLGFGFTLSGVGGLIAMNRGLDTIAIAGGLKSGAVDALLFPDDPINDAPLIIAMIDDYFPLLDGNTVVGPIVEIGWGAPKPLLTAQIGVIISLPEGKIGLLGSISALLPDPAAPLLTLNMDIVGEVDLPGGTLFLAASLHDSNLLEIFELSGDMGMFLSVGDQPYFLLSVGGYHPGFEPPSLVPAPLRDLARMRAAVEIGSSVSVALTCYFAVTSNTVQFGAAVALVATVEIWPTTYTARGDLGFDVLLRFSPFAIIAEFEAGVGIYSGDKELMGVHLTARLEGPEPWFCSGHASFRFFGIKVNFEVVVGDKAPPEAKEIVDLRADVLAAMVQRSAWREVPPASGMVAGVKYIDPAPPTEADDGRIWVRPDHQLRMAQSVAPLGRTIEIVGQGLPAPADSLLTVTAAGIGAIVQSPLTEVTDWFAPAQFEVLGPQEKLSRSSFEEMPAGVSFGEAALRSTAFPAKLGRSVEIGHEEVLWDDAPAVKVIPAPGSLRRAALSGSAAQSLRRAEPAVAGEFAILPMAFTVVDVQTGVEVGATLDAVGVARGGVPQSMANRAQADSVAACRVVSASSALEAVP
jgi:hypothetical protein